MLAKVKKVVRPIRNRLDLFLDSTADFSLMERYFEYTKMHEKLLEQAKPVGKPDSTAQRLLTIGYSKVEIVPEDIELIKEMGKRFNYYIEEKKWYQRPLPNRPDTDGLGKYLFNFDKKRWKHYFPEIPYIIERNLGIMLRSYFGANFEIFNISLARKRYLPPDDKLKEPFSNFWHFDWRRRDGSWLLALLHLNDHTHEESYHTFDLPTSFECLKKNLHGRYPPRGLPDELKDKQIVTTGGPAGSCYVANPADMLHRGGDPGPDKDRDVAFVFIGADVPWPTNNGLKFTSKHQIISPDTYLSKGKGEGIDAGMIGQFKKRS